MNYFFSILEKYKEAKGRMDTDEGKKDFVELSLKIHSAKGFVPKRLWSLINK
jgi:hypothetical protein